MARCRAVNSLRSRLAYRRHHRPSGGSLPWPPPESADQRPTEAHEELAGVRLLALLGVDHLASAPLALQQLRGKPEHPRFGQMPAPDRVVLISIALGSPRRAHD